MSIILNSKQLHYPLSGSFTGSFFGNLNGTASYSETASYIANIDTVFVKNQTNNSSSNTVKQYQNIFNHDNYGPERPKGIPSMPALHAGLQQDQSVV